MKKGPGDTSERQGPGIALEIGGQRGQERTQSYVGMNESKKEEMLWWVEAVKEN